MAASIYTGNVPSALGLNDTPNVALSGGGDASGLINSVTGSIYMSTNAYANYYTVTVALKNSGGTTLKSSVRSDIKFTSENYGGAAWAFSFDTDFDVNTVASFDISATTNSDKIFVKSNQSVTVDYTVITDPTAPTSVSLANEMAAPGAAVNLSWSGQSAGEANPITGYIISRSEDGGAYNDSWATDSASPLSVAAHASYGHYYRYRVITVGQYSNSPASTDTATLTTYTPTDCGAPTSATFSVSVSENAPTLTYSGASAGTINSITGYEIEYAESSNNSSWGAWTALKTVTNTGTSGTTTVNLSGTRGYYRKYQIRTQGSAGSSYYSTWKETASVRKNSAPTAPTSFTAEPAVYVSGVINLSYPGATDPDNNLSHYNIGFELSENGVDWHDWEWLADGTTSHTPTLTPGQYIRYSVAAADAFGIESAYVDSNICGKNTAPAAPVITLPQNSKTIYNGRPRFLITMGADPESQLQSIAASGYTASTASGLAGSAKTILRRTSAASAGAVSISAVSTDQYAESSSAAARDTTYAVPSFTDATITAGTTAIKAAHMTELRTMINTVRAYYGLSAISWAETITAGVTKARNWAAHIVEMQDAVDDVVALVNGWDTLTTTNRIVLSAWLATGSKPSAAVMEQIRAAIVLL